MMINDNNILDNLQKRGLISKITDEKALIERLNKGVISLYCGFDPTADSLHLGHLVPLLCLKRFQNAGHKPIILIGGATGLIGDPSFKAKERKFNTIEIINEWIEKITNQISHFLSFDCGENSAVIVNNYSWFSEMNVLTFLRDIGKYFSVNHMINREAVKQRLNREEQGISFTEFSYNLLQGYDFAELNKRYGVVLQIGGSDQWGNIISGIEITRRLYQKQVWGLTVPLITKADGSKFGKTEGNTIWLDAKKTTPYRFYQFWINTSDADVFNFLNFFTFLDIQEINSLRLLIDKNNDNTSYAQYLLAENLTRLVHGDVGLSAAKRITKNLFSNEFKNITEYDFEQLSQDGMPVISLHNHENNLQNALVSAKLVPSKGQARHVIASKAITINGEKQSNIEYCFTDTDRLFGRFTLLRRGKKHYCLIHWQ